ncbi:hypothetical protein RUM43_002894 [Polyplax serrata]|uniref:Protein BANP n=1 Tax=Polyplax serrata TaxID=468196 RepID=A0AAN8S575_POLSC
MSQIKSNKRLTACKNECITQKYNLKEIETLISTMLSPIIQEISTLTRMVTSVLSIVNKKENNDVSKITKNCEFASSSIATDVTMMASSMHRLTKIYENIKEQMTENKKCIDKFYGKLYNVEKLLNTFLKIENNKTMKQLEEQILKKVSNLEQMLVGEMDVKLNSLNVQSPDKIKPFQVSESVALDSSLQLITLNSEEDFPNGSWLGDASSTKCRVRCPIPEEDLIYVNTTCSTPEKMALTLLDYLFTRETLAVSNLSGKSKLGKKKLDPLMIYGIKCHLMHHFNISDKQWERIKLKMDSKCRSAWKKRKLNGPTETEQEKIRNKVNDGKTVKEDGKMIEAIEQVMVGGLKAQVIHTLQGNIEVLQTSRDQILIHSVQNGDYILPVMDVDSEDFSNIIPLSAVDSGTKAENEENLTIITTNDTNFQGCDAVSFVTEPMLEVFTEDDALKIESSVLIEEG